MRRTPLTDAPSPVKLSKRAVSKLYSLKKDFTRRAMSSASNPSSSRYKMGTERRMPADTYVIVSVRRLSFSSGGHK